MGKEDASLTAIAPTQLPLDYQGKRYSGVYSVSGTLMIARIPGVGSSSLELSEAEDPIQAANNLLAKILKDAEQAGLL